MRQLRSTTVIALTVASALTACGEETLVDTSFREVDEIDGLTLEVAVANPIVAIGDSVTAMMTLRNATGTAKHLQFGSGCQIMPFIETAAGELRHPGSGAWACTAALTSLEVPAHGAVVRSITLRGASSPTAMSPYFSLPAGSYRFYAKVDPFSRDGQLRSADVAFEVR